MDMTAKIAALLNKANAKGVTDAEARAFTAKAAELMEKHRISEAEVRDIDPGAQAKARIEDRMYFISNKANRAAYRLQAIVDIAIAYGGKCVQRKLDNGDIRLTVLATVGTLEILDLLVPNILDQIEYHVNKASRKYVRELTGYGLDRSEAYRKAVGFRNDYTSAYGHGVAQAIYALQDAEAAAAGALVLVGDKKRVEEEFSLRYNKLKKARKRSRQINPDGYFEGLKAGKKANLHTTVSL